MQLRDVPGAQTVPHDGMRALSGGLSHVAALPHSILILLDWDAGFVSPLGLAGWIIKLGLQYIVCIGFVGCNLFIKK